MVSGGAVPAGSSRSLRLDPMALPVSFPANDAGADERVRQIEIHRERVVVRRAVRGVPMRVSLPTSDYLGVAIRIIAPDENSDGAVAVMLAHRDPALWVPLFVAADGVDVLAEWRRWADVFALPLLICEPDGSLREAFPRMGGVRVEKVSPRRRRRGSLKYRRPSILLRRKPGRALAAPAVYRGEREIIARN
jgi:hypothetical protein